MVATAWVQLVSGNDWGAIFYTLPGENLRVCGQNATYNSLQIQHGDRVTVRFPDGSVAEVCLESRLRNVMVDDMGHSYSVVQETFGFRRSVNGIDVWIDLNQIEVPADRFRRKRDGSGSASRPDDPNKLLEP